ncbi:MAG: GNAT family N-acetyltransferase [Planctomycetota bacterium]
MIDSLVGFAFVAWDGGVHGFLLEPTVRRSHQRHGIGRRLVHEATQACRARRLHWLHVDFEDHLEPFYRACGFRPAKAGLIRLDED